MSDIVAARIKEARAARKWRTADLAARCAELGHAELTENAIENIEGGRRDRAGRRRRAVTVDELLVLAYALDIAPVHLIAGLDDDARVPVTPSLTVDAQLARRWIRGFRGLPGTDPRRFLFNVPEGEARTHWQALRVGADIDEVEARLRETRAEVERIKQTMREDRA